MYTLLEDKRLEKEYIEQLNKQKFFSVQFTNLPYVNQKTTIELKPITFSD